MCSYRIVTVGSTVDSRYVVSTTIYSTIYSTLVPTSSAGLPHASDITNFGSLYPIWFSQEMTFIISEIRYKWVRYIEVLLYLVAPCYCWLVC